MANPYYIQPQRNPMLDVMNMGMQLYGMRKKQALGEKELAMKGKEFDLGEKEYFARLEQNRATNVREDKRLNIEQGKADFEKNKWTQTNATITPISDAKWTKQKIGWQNGLEEQGYDPKSVKEFFENFDPIQEQGQLTPRVGLSKLTTERKELIKPWLNAEQKKLDKLIADGYSPDSLQVNQAIERVSFLKSDKLPMSFFPGAYIAEMQSQKAHQQALELKATGRTPGRLYPTTEGYKDRAGAMGKLAPRTEKAPTGELSQSAVIKAFNDYALYSATGDMNTASKMTTRFNELMKDKKITRMQAYNQTMQEFSQPKKETKVVNGMTFEKRENEWVRIK